MASIRLEAKEITKLERDLLSLLIVASFTEEEMISQLFPTFSAIAGQIKRAIANRSSLSRGKADDSFNGRKAALTKALYDCGIPLWIARRNAAAFMIIRPDFDLASPKHRRIRQLLEEHQQIFADAYYSISHSNGKAAADAWLKYIREQDVFFARIVALPDDMPSRYLFGA